MITILHGDDTSLSRNSFYELKKMSSGSRIFDGEKLELTDLIQETEGGGLFNEQKKLFIEHFFLRKQSLAKEELVKYFNKNKKVHDFVFWEGKELTKSQQLVFKDATVQLFSYPKSMFAFLENIRPKNTKTIELFHKALETNEADLLFHMLVRQFRLLLAVSTEDSNPIDEVKRMAPWQKSRLTSQARNFSQRQLATSLKKLFVIDLNHKTGKETMPISITIDFFLLAL